MERNWRADVLRRPPSDSTACHRRFSGSPRDNSRVTETGPDAFPTKAAQRGSKSGSGWPSGCDAMGAPLRFRCPSPGEAARTSPVLTTKLEATSNDKIRLAGRGFCVAIRYTSWSENRAIVGGRLAPERGDVDDEEMTAFCEGMSLEARHPTQCNQCVVPFATRCPISMIRPNRSSMFIDWCDVSPCLLSNARMSSMIVFSVSVNR